MAGARTKPSGAGKYQGYYTDAAGKTKYFTGTRSRPDTLKIARRLEDEAALVRAGVKPATSYGKHRARPFDDLVKEYRAWGESQGGRNGRPWGRERCKKVAAILAFWRSELNLETVADLDGVLPRVEAVLRKMQDEGRAGKTLQSQAEPLGGLCSWAKRRGYIAQHPLDGMGRFDTSPRTMRRALTPDEIGRLLDAAPERRRLVYETALASGLRKGELQSLQVDDLDTARGGLRLDAQWTKNRRPGFQHLPAWLVGKLQAYGERGEAARLYARRRPAGVPERPLLYVTPHTAREFAKDCTAAGVKKWGPGGKIDFHALRTTFVSTVVSVGTDTRTAMTLARHATPNLTLNTYARTKADALAGVAANVAGVLLPNREIANGLQKQAVGAEGLDVNAISVKGLRTQSAIKASGSNPLAPT